MQEETNEKTITGGTPMLWSISGGVIIFVLGVFIFLKPDLVWKLTEAWKSYRADEPSELYLKTTKIGGILFALSGVVIPAYKNF